MGNLAVDESAMSNRVRPPRYISQDGVLQQYSLAKSSGQLLLWSIEDAKYAPERFRGHWLLGSRGIVLTTSQRILYVVTTKKLEVKWQTMMKDIVGMETLPDGVLLRSASNSSGSGSRSADTVKRVISCQSEVVETLYHQLLAAVQRERVAILAFYAARSSTHSSSSSSSRASAIAPLASVARPTAL